MADLKLARLPDRTPVKIAITVSPELNRALRLYADLYRETYGQAEPVPELIPYMLAGFLDNDRCFAKARKEGEGAGNLPELHVVERPVKKRGARTTESPPTQT
jgi:hypothetical protein